MKIVVTGAGGFVGRNLVHRLADRHEVVATDSRLGDITGMEGDLRDPALLGRLFEGGCDAVVHLATVPGGAAEINPLLAKQVNIDATMALIDAAARAGNAPRFVFASSIAALGDPLPKLVEDATPLTPTLLYGAHKAMMELWIDNQTRRGAIRGLSLRLPGIVARPKAPSGMKSAFMSDVFHALIAGDPIVLPVGPEATLWLMSVERLAGNLEYALTSDAIGAMTLPSCRLMMADLVAAIVAGTGAKPDLVRYQPDEKLQATFGNYPPLHAKQALGVGFQDDGGVDTLVASALSTIHHGETRP